MIEWIDKAVMAFYAQSDDLRFDKENKKTTEDNLKSGYSAMKKLLKN
ncbi:MAG: hypothetical protein JNL70_26745 [Saprospiraceae bacterium]|nr:hypothetical protein [Saprospiraceae bacterium]